MVYYPHHHAVRTDTLEVERTFNLTRLVILSAVYILLLYILPLNKYTVVLHTSIGIGIGYWYR